VESYYQIYLSLICLAFVLSFVVYRIGYKKSIFLLIVLFATLLTEGYSTYAFKKKISFVWLYDLFNPVEYTMFCLYYINSCPGVSLKKVAKYSIPAFIAFSLSVSYFLYHFNSIPSIQINTEGVLLFLFYTHLIFCLDLDLKVRIYMHPDFWIAIAVMIFFGGDFVFLGLYPYLFKMNSAETIALFSLITRPLNLVFYSCLNTAFICSIRNKKYFIS
jgi:hypothetical protein